MPTYPEILKIRDESPVDEIAQYASACIQQGKIVVCATDTGYLLGVDGLNTTAIQQIYQIKARDLHKPMHLVVADVAMAKTLAYMDYTVERIFERFLPGPLTLILKKKAIVPNLLVSGLETVGLRIPQNDLLLRIVQAAGTPITATSANRSGRGTPYTVGDVLAELGPKVESVDLILDQGKTLYEMPSTILDVTADPPKILREGPLAPKILRQFRVL
ncbi:threonylcarbamoyl-AMP synthase [candidate division KSB3 bacterium]|uniref:L-threonylcarbamoyladenylate synthase n=1 Tax=candidate division KSB3 bacterium TaxID=2044937 RepID=A0A9D5JTI0_9BACT|nr:threonylcarbamoyl-AMP synthase [candidate division KSB3 bacterium]MBD3323351.1 threonylcarbamoyl-AMP synthase [candidate division KSB3 bacterium]